MAAWSQVRKIHLFPTSIKMRKQRSHLRPIKTVLEAIYVVPQINCSAQLVIAV